MNHSRPQAIFVIVMTMALVTGAAAMSEQPSQTQQFISGGTDTAFAVMHLREVDGTCSVIHKTERVRLSKSKKPNLEFVVVNDCAMQVVVSVSNFTHDSRPAATDPIETGAPDRRRTIPANRSTNGFRLKVRGDATEGTWSYIVRVDDRAADPKIDIEP